MNEGHAAVSASNDFALTWLRWCEFGGNVLISPPSCAEALAVLLTGASGTTRDELRRALGIAADDAPIVANVLSEIVDGCDGVLHAGGLWASPAIDIRADFRDSLPRFEVGALPANPVVLDRGIADRTNSLIDRFPVAIDSGTRLVVAAAITAEAEWIEPFTDGRGKWSGSTDWVPWLWRQSTNLDDAALIIDDITVSRAKVETTGGFDVHLLGGDLDTGPFDVLRAGMRAVEGATSVISGSQLRAGDRGGMLAADTVSSATPDSHIALSLPAFTVDDGHDLLHDASVFGLVTALDTSHGHFDGISTFPLALSAARHSTISRFTAQGFKAAATTAMMGVAAGVPRRTDQLVISIEMHRPFGFLVVDRATDLILFAGWVSHPGRQTDQDDQGCPNG